jgi:hypothetical protein
MLHGMCRQHRASGWGGVRLPFDGGGSSARVCLEREPGRAGYACIDRSGVPETAPRVSACIGVSGPVSAARVSACIDRVLTGWGAQVPPLEPGGQRLGRSGRGPGAAAGGGAAPGRPAEVQSQ